MKQEIMKHKWAYSFLALGLGVLMLSFMAVWPDRTLQRLIVLAMAAYYFVWGVITHVKAETISRRVIMEYGGVSLLAAFLLLMITF